jgi:hypothetical protein
LGARQRNTWLTGGGEIRRGGLGALRGGDTQVGWRLVGDAGARVEGQQRAARR